MQRAFLASSNTFHLFCTCCSLCYFSAFSTPLDVVRYPPSYSLGLLDTFTTLTGEDLTTHCTQGYSTEWLAKTSAMVDDLIAMISDGRICHGLDQQLTVNLASSGFYSLDNEVCKMLSIINRPNIII